MKACLISNGLAVPQNIRLIEQMNLYSIGISLDGMRPVHNFLRNNKSSYDCVLQSIQLLRGLFLDLYVITQVNKYNLADMESLYQLLLGYDQVDGWQIQLTNDMGRAEDLENSMLSRPEIKQVLDFILAKQAGPLKIYPADDLGYYYRNSFCFTGCQGGISVIGIEADGTVKPCLSMQKDTRFDGGNIRERSLLDIWHDSDFAKINRQERQLQGQCAKCRHLKACRGGCESTALAFDSLEQYPFCLRTR
jgi:radical SAM protein with 4Fe4S-binding SPASM domain